MSRQRVSERQVGGQGVVYGESGEYTRKNRCTTKKVRERTKARKKGRGNRREEKRESEKRRLIEEKKE